MLHHLGRHSMAGIADTQAHEPTRLDTCEPAVERGVHVDHRRVDQQRAAGDHRVASVDRRVHEHLLDPAAIGNDRGRLTGQSHIELDLLTDGSSQHVLDAADHVVERDQLGAHHLAAPDRGLTEVDVPSSVRARSHPLAWARRHHRRRAPNDRCRCSCRSSSPTRPRGRTRWCWRLPTV